MLDEKLQGDTFKTKWKLKTKQEMIFHKYS